MEIDDGSSLMSHLTREIHRRQWPPGLAEIAVNCVHPGLCMLILDTANRRDLRMCLRVCVAVLPRLRLLPF